MKRIVIIVCVLLCLSLTGCSWMNGSFVSVEPYQEQLSGGQSEALSAANYQQLRLVLENLVEAGTENAVISVAEYEQHLIEKGMETAVHHVRALLPLGAYAVEDVSYEIGTVGGEPAISVEIDSIHGRAELRKVRRVGNMEEAQMVITDALAQCADGIVLLIDQFSDMDLVQMVEDYALENPNLVMEIPEVAVGLYPDSGNSRVVELKFTYQTSRDALRQMQTQVQRVFVSASLYVSSDGEDSQRIMQLYTFLTERFDYQLQTSITPAYSLLCHGVGDSKAFASVFATMCRRDGLECMVISGTCDGAPRFWNLIREGDIYYHVDLLRSKEQGSLRLLTDEQMTGYVWDYSAYPAAGSSTADQ